MGHFSFRSSKSIHNKEAFSVSPDVSFPRLVNQLQQNWVWVVFSFQ